MAANPREREPCPDRILDDVGIGFAIGAVGGSAFQFFRGLKNSPKGERFFGATQAVRMNVPRVAGGFAVWSCLFSVFDCSAVYLRQKEDPWNSIIAGASASGSLQMRQGLRAASRSALVGGALFALIEGAHIVVSKIQPPLILLEEDVDVAGAAAGTQGAALDATTSSSGSSWFGNLFRGQKEEAKKSGGGVKEEILESFDTPVPPTFEFK